jgi:hypothetical protein
MSVDYLISLAIANEQKTIAIIRAMKRKQDESFSHRYLSIEIEIFHSL